MDKPRFIRGLLEEVGTAINPITLVRRIPEGLEIEGLREGIGRMVREYEIQHSISAGVAKVLRGEVAQGMDILRAGQKRGVKFDVVQASPSDSEAQTVVEAPTPTAAVANGGDHTSTTVPQPSDPAADPKPGHCTGCHRPFASSAADADADADDDADDADDLVTATATPSRDTLVGFACGHVYHLSCLLPKTSASASVAATLQARLAADAGDDGYGSSRSVGAKVAHAHVIRSAIRDGCPVCAGARAEGEGEGGGGG